MTRFLRAATLVLFAVHGAIALAGAPPLTCPTIAMAPTSLPNGDLATAYTPTVTSSGGTTPVAIDITHGVLPNGVNLTDNGDGTATFSGTSTQTGSFEFTLTATDTNGCSGGRTYAPTFATATSSTALALTTGPNPSVFGQSLTFTATVTSGSGTPAGNVTFKDGAATLGTVALDGAGQATFTTSTLTVGTHSPITAVYAGNPSFAGSTSNALSQTVNQATTATTLVSSPSSSVFGQSVTFTATVTANPPGGGTPTGTVTFFDGITNIGSGPLNGSGVATFSTGTLTVGAHQITATYGADTNFAGSTSSILTQTVNQAATTTALTSGTNPSVFGQSVTFTATVTATAPGAGTPTGTVNFLDGATPIGSGALNGSGVATFTTSTLAVGSHPISASYSADVNFGGSTGGPLSQVVNQAATSTALFSSINPSAANQSVTFTAIVTATAPGAGTPTGTANFFDGATNLGPGTLNGSGQATFTTSTLTVGGHSITATYSGDVNFTTSTSAPLTQTVNLNPSTTTLVSSVNPTVFGQSTTFTATVTGTGTPTGTVAFMEGPTVLGSGPLVAGVATFSTGALAVGPHTITAVYSGDGSFASSASAPVIQTVNQAATTTTVGSSVNPSVFGQSVTFTATVAPVAPGAGTPTGTVTFKEGATILASAVPLNGSSQATFTSGAFSIGAHQITAFYSADTNFLASDNTAAPLTQTINQAATTTTVASGTNPSVFGQSVTFTATVTAVAPGAGTPTGTVTFKDGATTLGTGALNGSGQATFATGALTLGGHSITASYGADTNFTASTSSALIQTVNQAATTTTVVSSQNPSVTGQSVTFTATVTATAPGAGTPTGTVTFKDGATTIGSGTLAAGVATMATTTLAVGSHSITASYGGDANFTVSTSSALTQNVNQPPAITSANNTTFAPGKTGQTFTVTTTGFPSGASMSITQSGTVPSAVTFTNNNNGTATIAGTPAALTQNASPYLWTITANNGVAPNANQSFTFNVVCPAITVSGAIPALTFNTAMASTTFTQAGGNGTIAWTATGLPPGVTINSGSGAVTGTPTATGTFNSTITATDAGGCTGTKAVSVPVGPNAPVQAYTGVGNTQFFITGVTGAPTTPAVSSGNTLLTGVTPTSTITAASCSVNGTLSAVDTAGHFIMTPNVNAASVTCTYTATSDSGTTGTPASTTANLTFTLNNKVWYVSHGSAGTHDGRSNTPFLDMGGGANNLDCTTATAIGDFIYIAQGTAATTGACVLKASQTLIGAGAALNVPTASPILTVAGSAAATPTLTGTLTVANNVTVDGIDMSTAAAAALINAAATTGISLHVRNLTTTTGAGISMTTAGNTGNITVDTFNVGAAANGINLGSLGGTLTVNTASITNTTGAAMSLAGVTTANLSGVGATTISTNTAGGTGLVLNATALNIGTGGVSIATSGGASGVSDSGGTVTIAAGANNFSITNTNAGPGLVATSGGTLTITGSNNKITTATGTALNVANTTIGAGGLNFQSINSPAASANSGIILNNAGATGGLTVAGGTISNKTAAAVSLTSTVNVSLSSMTISNNSPQAIVGSSVNGFSLSGSTAAGNAGTGSAAIFLTDTAGAVAFINDSVTGTTGVNGFNVQLNSSNASSAAITTLTVTGGAYSNSAGNGGFLVNQKANAKLGAAFFSGVTFASNFSKGLQLQQNDNSIMGDSVTAPLAAWGGGIPNGSVTVTGCTFTNNNVAASFEGGGGTGGTGSTYYRFINNTNITGSHGVAVNFADGSDSGGGTYKALASGNHIGTAGVPNSGSAIGEGIRVFMQGQQAATVTITNNIIRALFNGAGGFDARGIDVEELGRPNANFGQTPLNIKIVGNDVDQQYTGSVFNIQYAIYVAADAQGTGTSGSNVIAEIHGNTVPSTNPCDTQCGAPFGMIMYETVSGATGVTTGTLFKTGAGATLSAEIASTNTGTTGQTCSVVNGGSLAFGAAPAVVP